MADQVVAAVEFVVAEVSVEAALAADAEMKAVPALDHQVDMTDLLQEEEKDQALMTVVVEVVAAVKAVVAAVKAAADRANGQATEEVANAVAEDLENKILNFIHRAQYYCFLYVNQN